MVELDGGAIPLAAAGEAPCECVVGSSAAIEEPWTKLLGHDGFVIDRDLTSAEAKLEQLGDELSRSSDGSRA